MLQDTFLLEVLDARLIVMVNRKEFEALVQLALSEMRNPREQAHFLIRQALLDRELLSEEVTPDCSTPHSEAQDA